MNMPTPPNSSEPDRGATPSQPEATQPEATQPSAEQSAQQSAQHVAQQPSQQTASQPASHTAPQGHGGQRYAPYQPQHLAQQTQAQQTQAQQTQQPAQQARYQQQYAAYPATQQYPQSYQQPQRQPGAPAYPQGVQHQYAQASNSPAYNAQVSNTQGSNPQPASENKEKTSSGKTGGALVMGLLIGALIGGGAGGGAAAIIAANSEQAPIVEQTENGGTVTIQNPETATSVTSVAAVATQSVVTLNVTSGGNGGSGSGVIIDEDGYIITNTHVVTLEGMAGSNPEIRVQLSDGRILDGDLVGIDPFADIAVVKVDADNLQPIEVGDSSAVEVGDLSVAIGAPLNLSHSVTGGVVSALNRGISVGTPLIPDSDPEDSSPHDEEPNSPWDFRFRTPKDEGEQDASQYGAVTLSVIQTDAAINPGNSGGALLNGDGALIGVNVAIATNARSSDTAGSDGLGFAIPSNLAIRVANEIIDGKQPSHGLLGASVTDSSEDTDADANVAGGLLVDVSPGGPADEAGLESGDVVTSVNGIPAESGTSLSALIRMHEKGETVVLQYSRDGVVGETKVTLDGIEW